ncbi:uncharacterized protein LOC136072280 [Hydra vulgaris]|uniref:uncharacterized protein LOC136072280 n=1 Tax=Hydra vulgaris TaxID=6087 RepID=UPI0032EA5DE1
MSNNNQAKKTKTIEALDPDIRKKLCGIKNAVPKGRPLACDQGSLIKTIVDIALKGSASNDRRRTEIVRTVKTLDDLVEELKNHGYNFFRSGVYLRLLSSRSLSTEGKRHAKTAPVTLIRAQNSEHKYHADTKFAKSSISALEELTAVLGPKEVTFLSQDDKARVPIGLTAANKQAPITMHMEYKVTLADHDFVIAPQHKLIPSVIAAIEIKKDCMEKQAVTYSGPTYIAIRSAKHDSSTALSHLEDINRINHLLAFESSLFTEDGVSKQAMVITVDGGPDENPRYEKTILCAKTYFKEHDFDGMFVATNAPGRSAFNRIERRMAPQSHDLEGIILPFNHFGSHLNSRGKTTDKLMEKANFAKAGEVLAQIWSSTVIHGFETIAEYKEPNSENRVQLKQFGAEWDAKHVKESQYLLQIVKCNDQNCCCYRRSSLFHLIPTGFLLPPISLFQGENGLECNNTKNNFASLMCVFLNSDKETIEWHDQDDVDTSDLNWPSIIIKEHGTLILEGQIPIWEQI